VGALGAKMATAGNNYGNWAFVSKPLLSDGTLTTLEGIEKFLGSGMATRSTAVLKNS